MNIIEQQDVLWEANRIAGEELNKLCENHRGLMGLVSDEFRLTLEYRKAKLAYDRSFRDLREFNSRNSKALRAARLAMRVGAPI